MGKGGFDGGLEGDVGGVTAVWQVVVVEVAPERLDRVEFGTIGREEAEMDIARRQHWDVGRDGLAVVDRVVVQHDHARPRPRADGLGGLPRQAADEGQVRRCIVAPLGRAAGREDEAWSGGVVGAIAPTAFTRRPWGASYGTTRRRPRRPHPYPVGNVGQTPL